MQSSHEYPHLDYLVIAPHPDDAELGLGGTMLLLKAEGARLGILDLTNGEPTPHGTPEIRHEETAAAAWQRRKGRKDLLTPRPLCPQRKKHSEPARVLLEKA